MLKELKEFSDRNGLDFVAEKRQGFSRKTIRTYLCVYFQWQHRKGVPLLEIEDVHLERDLASCMADAQEWVDLALTLGATEGWETVCLWMNGKVHQIKDEHGRKYATPSCKAQNDELFGGFRESVKLGMIGNDQ